MLHPFVISLAILVQLNFDYRYSNLFEIGRGLLLLWAGRKNNLLHGKQTKKVAWEENLPKIELNKGNGARVICWKSTLPKGGPRALLM